MSTDCIVWNRAKYGSGYGQVNLKGYRTGAHRAAWIRERGEIPDGLEIDHLCRNRLCVNVEHMELVTRAENMRRYWATRTTCAKGLHPRVGKGACKPCVAKRMKEPIAKAAQARWEAANKEKRRAYIREWMRKKRAAAKS